MDELIAMQNQYEYEEKLQRVIHESIMESRKNKEKSPKKGLKERLKNFFRRKKKLEEVKKEDISIEKEEEKDEIITFHINAAPELLRGESLDKSIRNYS